ncbi:recombination-associated protein RdgC [Pleionea sediminis]|uniref:recombination-associated protein RdgC n=1 Tax=Pleionea sediminis TaxID=2569479 RepID=UPI0011868AF2|nr:recombination-associated protein RdgC [Pleionea sediminis]
MWFRNFQLYRFVEKFSLTEQELADKLNEFRFQPCGRQSKETVGWISPLHRNEDELVYEANGCLLFCMRKEQKVIPPSMVNEALEERVAEIEFEQGRKVFRKEKQQFKEDIMAMLLPKAFTRATHTHAYIDTRNGFMLVNAASIALADTFISLLVDSLGVLGAVKIDAEMNPAQTMSQWLQNGVPDDWALSGDYELKDPADDRVARFKDNESENQVINDLLDDGYWVSKLGIHFKDILKCTIQDDLQIKSVKFSDELLNQNDELEIEDHRAKFDADYVLMTQTVAQFYEDFCSAFQINDGVSAPA